MTDIAKDVFKIQHVLDYWSFYTLEEMSNLNQEMEEKVLYMYKLLDFIAFHHHHYIAYFSDVNGFLWII